MLKRAAKSVCRTLAAATMFIPASVSGFGQLAGPFLFFGQLVALMPGVIGDYIRVAYYAMTLRECSSQSRISFGTFFAQSSTVVGRGVYIGAYCVIGSCEIGDRTQIASQVQILSGRHQHARNADGQIMGAADEEFTPIVIGADCWIGASAILMADVGPGTTIGAGSVVTRPVSENVVAVGNPVRVLELAK